MEISYVSNWRDLDKPCERCGSFRDVKYCGSDEEGDHTLCNLCALTVTLQEIESKRKIMPKVQKCAKKSRGQVGKTAYKIDKKEIELFASELVELDRIEDYAWDYLDEAKWLMEKGYRREVETAYEVLNKALDIVHEYIPDGDIHRIEAKIKAIGDDYHLDWEDSK